jgi:hypothetical protein
MHMVHMNTKYQSMEDARSQPDGFAILAVLLVVRKGLWPRTCFQKQGLGVVWRDQGSSALKDLENSEELTAPHQHMHTNGLSSFNNGIHR